METQDKQLLFKALFSYLPYKVICYTERSEFDELDMCDDDIVRGDDTILSYRDDSNEFCSDMYGYDIENIKPYLRPMSSMTEEEIKEWDNICVMMRNMPVESIPMVIRFVNSKHLDYYNLIPKGLALEAPADMYND